MLIILKFEDDDYEEIDIESLDDIRYWVHRRLEKSGKRADKYFIVQKAESCDKIVKSFYRARDIEDRRIREEEEKREYERLKNKYSSRP